MTFWIRRLVTGSVRVGSILGRGLIIYAHILKRIWLVGPLMEDGDGVGVDGAGF